MLKVEIGYHKAGVLIVTKVLGFRYHPPGTGPTVPLCTV